MTRRLFVANRGEIAVRIIRTAHVLGWETIAIHSDADAGALWTRLATSAVGIGGDTAASSYLDIPKVIDAARRAGATAVHPGYGMLSESADFARAVNAAGLTFVGPDPETIAVMGDKLRARAAAAAEQVPVLPASAACVTQDDALSWAEQIGWPVLIKASHGGGGRGMRVAHDAAALSTMMDEAAREARAAFGSGDLFLESYLPHGRHIEVQLIGTTEGMLVLGDRDCSLQRRRQKIIEEAPAPFLSDGLRAQLHEAARRIGRASAYSGAGTVEFLVDIASGRYFFLEMNTRLQVEHGVTELVTGLDLVALQLRLAGGEPMEIGEADIVARGHAIQARITAEDAAADFLPVTGKVRRLSWPGGPGVRCDAGIVSGDIVSPFYDSMFAKVMAWGADRETARLRLGLALDEVVTEGIGNSAAFAALLVRRREFAEGRFNTGSVERRWAKEAIGCLKAPAVGPNAADTGRLVRLPWGSRQVTLEIGVASSQSRRPDPAGSCDAIAAPVRSQSHSHDVIAPMEGSIVSLLVAEGARVAAGEVVMTMEAMKMEISVRSPQSGTIADLRVAVGSVVAKGTSLAKIRVD